MSRHIDISELGKYIYPAFADKVQKKSKDINTTMEIVLIHELVQYLHLRGINLLLISGPNKRKIKLSNEEHYLFGEFDISDVMKDRTYMEKFFHGDKSLLDYAYDKNAGLLNGNRITTNGIHLMSAWFRSEWVNVTPMGERKSLDATSGKFHNDIYIYGSCLTFGLFADDRRTFPSFLQDLLNKSDLAGMCVHNYGVKGRNCVLNDLLYALNTPLKQGDTVILIEKFSEEIKNELKKTRTKLYDFSDYLNTITIEKYSFLNSAFHCNDKIYKMLADYSFGIIMDKYRFNFDGTTSMPAQSYFEQNNRIQLIDSDGLIDGVFINDLKRKLKKDKFTCTDNAVIGSIVMTANPFTWGHARLVDLVAKECDYVYVFVIEDEHFDIPFKVRYEMVNGYVEQFPNCKCISTGSYFGADFLFPEYHDRKNYENKKINNPIIDTMIFAKHIVPILGINRRYLGTEETDPVTRQFNDYLISVLPKFNIEVRIIPRFTTSHSNQKISGSYVRDLIYNKPDTNELQSLLPPSSLKTLHLL